MKVRTIAVSGALALLLLVPNPGSAQDRSRTRARERDARERLESFREGLRGFSSWTLAGAGDHARIGISLDNRQRRAYDRRGALVDDVVEGGPAQDAGLEEGDIIVSVNGLALTDELPEFDDEKELDDNLSLPVQRLLAYSLEWDEGDQIEVEYLRDGETFSTTIEAADGSNMHVFGDNQFSFSFNNGGGLISPRVSLITRAGGQRGLSLLGSCASMPGAWVTLDSGCAAGLNLIDMNQGLASYFGSDAGVLVLDASDESELGLLPGDVILAIGDRQVEDVEDAHRIMASYDHGESISFRIRRRNSESVITGIHN